MQDKPLIIFDRPCFSELQFVGNEKEVRSCKIYTPLLANCRVYTRTSKPIICTMGSTTFLISLAGIKGIDKRKLFMCHFVPSTDFNLSMNSFLGAAFFAISAVVPSTISSSLDITTIRRSALKRSPWRGVVTGKLLVCQTGGC